MIEAQQRRQFVEEITRLLESGGMPRMAARVVAELTLTESPPYPSMRELSESLGVSKGHLSTALRHLVDTRMVEVIAVPGARGDRYRLAPGAWAKSFRRALDIFAAIGGLAGEALTHVDQDSPGVRRALLELRDFMRTLTEENKRIIERFENRPDLA